MDNKIPKGDQQPVLALPSPRVMCTSSAALRIASHKMPGLRQFVLAVIAVIGTALFMIFVLARPRLKSPFAGYENLFSATPLHAAAALGFDCKFSSDDSTMGDCGLRPVTGLFSRIEVTAFSADASDSTFWMKDGTLTLGDLILFWGAPIIMACDGAVMLSWPVHGITASAVVLNNQRVDYFLPIRFVIFGSNHVPEWEQLWLNDFRHIECRDYGHFEAHLAT